MEVGCAEQLSILLGFVGARRTIPGLWRLFNTCFLLLNSLLFSFCSLGFYGGLTSLLLSLSQSLAIQHSFLRLSQQVCTLRRVSCTALPVLHRWESSPQLCPLVPSTSLSIECAFQWRISEHERKLTVQAWPQIDIPKRDQHILTYVHTHIHCKNRAHSKQCANALGNYFSSSRMHCIVRRRWASSAWHEGEKSSSKQWHEGKKRNNLVGYCFELAWSVFALIWSPVPQQLVSFPGLNTGQGYSAVVLDRSQLSIAFLYQNAGEELETGGYISLARLPQQLLKQHVLLSLMSWAYSACAVFVCCFNSAEHCDVRFYVSLWGSSVVCMGDFKNTIVPYWWPLKLHF